MGNIVDLNEAELLNLARAIERDCQEGVKWERRKLEWILEEEHKQAGVNKASEAA